MSEDFVLEDGLQDMTAWNGYLSWVCLPHFLWANESLAALFATEPNESKHLSEVKLVFFSDVELVTFESVVHVTSHL